MPTSHPVKDRSRYFRQFDGNSGNHITRTDSGHREFNFSEIGGNLFGAGISNIYHPANNRSLSNTLSVWATDIIWDNVANEAKEFWPDLRRKLRKSRAATAAQ